MRHISARQFRTTFPKLDEQVLVLQRQKDGEIAVLGTWTPAKPEVVYGLTNSVAKAITETARPITFTPVPKPSKRK